MQSPRYRRAVDDGDVTVRVTVYSLMAQGVGTAVLDRVGMSIYHAGVVVLGEEYSFGANPAARFNPAMDGVFVVEPRRAVGHGSFKESVALGELVAPMATAEAVRATVERLRPGWRAATYHAMNKNCCHFALELVTALHPSLALRFPHYVNRAASFGAAILPSQLSNRMAAAMVPPPSPAPRRLVNSIDVAFSGPLPSPLISDDDDDSKEGTPREDSALGVLHRVLRVASAVATGVASVVETVVTNRDRQSFARHFPELCDLASSLAAAYEADVVHCNVQQIATLFVTSKCVALCGDHRLHVVVPFRSIAALRCGRALPPAEPGLPPRAELLQGANARLGASGTGDDGLDEDASPVLMLYTKSSKMIPIFNIRPLVPSVHGGYPDVGGYPADPRDTFVAAFRAVEDSWKLACRAATPPKHVASPQTR
jgi:hypothetical protein